MIKKILLLGLIITSIISAKTVPSAIMGHKDVPDSTFGDSTSTQKILIVSRDSEFKRDIAYTVADSLATDSLFVRVGGVTLLKDLDPKKYSAIIILNTCLSWQIDNKVQDFFKDNPDYSEVVLFTTSGDPKGCGKGRHVPAYVDAISSASVKEDLVPKISLILSKAKVFLQ